MTEPTPDPAARRRRRAVTEELPATEAHGNGTHHDELDPAAADPAAAGMPASPGETPAAPDTAPVDVVRIERGGIGEATAGAVDVHMGGIGALTAEDVFVEWGGVGAARADKLGIEFGGIGAAMTGELRVTQGWASSVIAREATLEQAFARTVIAQHVDVRRPSAVLFLIAQRVEGDVRTLVDWRGALAFGAAFGLVAGLARAAGAGSRGTRRRRRGA
jgi:hypothetical protein